MSEAVSTLVRHGYVVKAPAVGRDRRHVGIVLSPKGVQAVRASSVLERRRLGAVLARLSARDLSVVIGGLTRLARACRPSGFITSQEA
jgi:DNA-binding MarR family transcriptional regulator